MVMCGWRTCTQLMTFPYEAKLMSLQICELEKTHTYTPQHVYLNSSGQGFIEYLSSPHFLLIFLLSLNILIYPADLLEKRTVAKPPTTREFIVPRPRKTLVTFQQL